MRINDCKIVGNLMREPEVQYTPKGTPMAKAARDVNETYMLDDGQKKQMTTFVGIQVWGASAENLARLVEKDQELFAGGSCRQETRRDKELGKARSKLFLKAESWQFTQPKLGEAQREVGRGNIVVSEHQERSYDLG